MHRSRSNGRIATLAAINLQFIGGSDGIWGSMPRAPDSRYALEETVLCEIVDIKRSRRQAWARDDLLRKASDGGKYGERDVVEAAALARLVRTLGYDDAVLAWRAVRHQVAEAISDAELDVVFDLTAKHAAVVVTDGDVAEFARSGNVMRLVSLGEVIAEVRAAWSRLDNARRARDEARTRASSGAGKR
jgi:hypothetical protein